MSHAELLQPIGLLLAGGRGSRFDSSGHLDKLLARVQGQAVCSRAAQTLTRVCPDSVAVLPPGKPELLRLLEQSGCKPLVTEATRLGMGHSIAVGAARIFEKHGMRPVVLALADMPHVKPETIQALIARLGEDPLSVVAPTFRQRRGHPVVFGAGHLAALAQLAGDRGAFPILQQYPPQLLEVDDPGVLQDIDTQDDLTAYTTDDTMDRRRDTPERHQP